VYIGSVDCRKSTGWIKNGSEKESEEESNEEEIRKEEEEVKRLNV